MLIAACFALTACATNELLPEVEPLPFTKGVNLLTYFDAATSDEMPNLNKHDEADFACLKSMGIDSLRLCCAFDIFTDKPDGTGKISDIVLEKLDQVCDWAEKYQIYLVIDNHNNHIFGKAENKNNYQLMQAQIEAVWSQLAPRYKDRSEYIIYEIMNEPPCENADKWYKVQQSAIELIRKYDTKHSIVVSCYNYSHADDLVKMKPYQDPNLIYTFHFYEPSIFTHQGAAWCGPEYSDLEDLPFPYDIRRLPKLKGRTKNSWVQWEIENEYQQTGTVKYINSSIKKVADWAKKNHIRVWVGEMGAKIWINPVDRLAWINATRTALVDNNIPYCTWGIDGWDGFLTSDNAGLIFPDDIDTVALEAYGFSMPDQKLAEKASLDISVEKPYMVYDGILGKGTRINYWGNTREIKDVVEHNYYISVSYPNQSNGCRFTLPNKIASKIAENQQAFSVSFAVKFTDKKQEFNLYLVDSDNGEEGLPWRKGFTIKASNYSLGEWTTIEIPISKFIDSRGTWTDKEGGKWYDLPCQFDWSRFEGLWFEFNDQSDKMTGDIYLDDVVIKQK